MFKVLLALKSPTQAILSLLKGHAVDRLGENESLFEAVAKNNYELILFEGEKDVLQSIKATDPRAEVIFFGDSEVDAIEAIKKGASAHFAPPVEIKRLKETIDNISDLFQVRKESAELEKLLTAKYTFLPGVIGKNPKMLDVFSLISRIAPYFKTVTIMGDTGTGKEIIGKTLHSLSTVAKHPFIVCNCAGLVETLVESELFGHTKGAFTGATADKMGIFEAALLSYEWPGNVRELENILEQASVITTETFIRLDDLPAHMRETRMKDVPEIMPLDDVVKKHIEKVLKKCNGNRSRASKILGISRRALLRKIEKHSII
jgi:DNA-binding NtrC family response regulator